MSNIGGGASSERRGEILGESLSGNDKDGDENNGEDGENGDQVKMGTLYLGVGRVSKPVNRSIRSDSFT